MHFHREQQKYFRTFFPGQQSVDEYSKEFDGLKRRLELEESEESLMA